MLLLGTMHLEQKQTIKQTKQTKQTNNEKGQAKWVGVTQHMEADGCEPWLALCRHFSSLHALPFEKSQLGIVRDIYMDTTVPSEKEKL